MASHRRHRRGEAAVLALAAFLAWPGTAAADDAAPGRPAPAGPAAPAPAPTVPAPPQGAVAPAAPARNTPAPAAPARGAPAPAAPTVGAPAPAVPARGASAPAAAAGGAPAGWRVADAPAGPAAPRSALMEAIDRAVGAPVHGTLAFRFEARLFDPDAADDSTSDFDLYTHLDARAGDEKRDTLSAAVYVRTNWDIGSSNEDGGADNAALGLSDTYEDSFNAQLYTAYVNWRPKTGAVESARFGRQYVYVAETFQLDGASATTRVLQKELNLRLEGYGGIPVHFFEADGSGDWIGGLRATADPAKGMRAALDYAHVEDEASGYSAEKNDLAAASVWQRIGENADLHGRFTWLDGPRDALLRGSVNFPERDLLLQASYKRLLDEQEHLATEFDPYYSELRTEHEYQQGEIRAVKGFGDRFSVEAGASARRVIHDSEESLYNRDADRLWIAPSIDDLWLDHTTLTVSCERWDGNEDDATRTVTADWTYRVDKETRLSLGTDFSRWDYGRVEQGERSNLRTAYVRVKTKVAADWTLDARYTWEHDDEETDHVFTVGLSLEF